METDSGSGCKRLQGLVGAVRRWRSALARILGFTQSAHTLERNQREMASAVEDFWKDRPTPVAEEEGELLVCTADGKGVSMRGGTLHLVMMRQRGEIETGVGGVSDFH